MSKKIVQARNFIPPARLILAVILAAVFQTPMSGAKGVAWETGLDIAMKKAAETGKPLLISMHTSSEKASIRMLNQVYQDPEVRAKLAHFVVLPTCVDRHDEIMEKVGGEERPVSTLFRTVDCKTLVKNEKEVRARFFDSGVVKVPQHVFIEVSGDGECNIFMTKVYELSTSGFLDLLEKALIDHSVRRIGGLAKHLKVLFETIRKGSDKKCVEAVQSILRLKDIEVSALLYPTIERLGREKDRARCVRAMGYPEFVDAAPVAMLWLTDKSKFVENCAVVTLEEMRAACALNALLDLYPEAKDKELKKDILRALGPCGAGDGRVKTILVESVESRERIYRLAAYLSLGFFLDKAEVVNLLLERFEKEGKNTVLKSGIVWAFRDFRNVDISNKIEKLVEKERNQQVKVLATATVKLMRGDFVEYDGALMKALRALYAQDKITRNEIIDLGNEKNNRSGGGRGGRGGRGR